MITVSPQWMLFTGIVLSIIFSKNERIQLHAKTWSSKLLQLSVILLGASLNFNSVLKQGAEGALITFISIAFVFTLGWAGRKLLSIENKHALLITMGTAICGGSAIGALAPVISADSLAIAISFGIVFFLNAISIFIFPFLGEVFSLSQDQFGLWAALAIHDTSSVVAASSIYGTKALEIATTVKLTRALWIIPITLYFSVKFSKSSQKKLSLPWFIVGFLLLSLAFTFIDMLAPAKIYLLQTSKLGFSLTLFLIGLTFNFKNIKVVGARPFIYGISLWIIVVISSLLYVKLF